MYLENLVFDAVDPQRMGRFWEEALGGETLTDEDAGFETRLTIDGWPVLDLCFQRVPEPPTEPLRLHLDLLGGSRQTEVVERFGPQTHRERVQLAAERVGERAQLGGSESDVGIGGRNVGDRLKAEAERGEELSGFVMQVA